MADRIKVATVKMKSLSQYSQSKATSTPRGDKEPPDEHESRVWRERMHVDSDGFVFIPPTAFKNALSEAAKFLSMSVPSKGKATYTKHFEAGVAVQDPLRLGVKADAVSCERLFVPADGRRGGGKRVWKNFPSIPSWSGSVDFLVLDETITKDVFERHIKAAGLFIGIGRYRPRNNGYYGRFEVTEIKWSEM